MKSIKYLIFLLALVVVMACDIDSLCGSEAVNYVTLSSFTTNNNGVESSASIAYDSIITAETDSIFLKDSTASSLALPLNPLSTRTDYYFYYNEQVDTLSFTYSKRNSVDSPECGIIFEFIGLDTNFQTFDSLIIVNDTLRRTVNAPNIKFYISQ